jgi:hypothetical protein
MRALTQCWFTRDHVPASRRGHKEADGSRNSHCTHCGRAILSWDNQRWFLADGFNITRLLETAGGRHLFLFDRADDMVIARFPVSHITDEKALAAYKEELREQHGADRPGSDLELLDTGAPLARAPKGAKARRSGYVPGKVGGARLSMQF